jgi:uncharacterized RDD family membrane protein YckC
MQKIDYYWDENLIISEKTLKTIKASGWSRIGARLLDGIFEIILMIPIIILIITSWDGEDLTSYLQNYAFLIIGTIFAYESFVPYFLKGQSLGKKIVGIRIVNGDGNLIPLSKLLIRAGYYSLLSMLSSSSASQALNMINSLITIISTIMVFSTEKGQAIQDMLINSVVVNDRDILVIRANIVNKLND